MQQKHVGSFILFRVGLSCRKLLVVSVERSVSTSSHWLCAAERPRLTSSSEAAQSSESMFWRRHMSGQCSPGTCDDFPSSREDRAVQGLRWCEGQNRQSSTLRSALNNICNLTSTIISKLWAGALRIVIKTSLSEYKSFLCECESAVPWWSPRQQDSPDSWKMWGVIPPPLVFRIRNVLDVVKIEQIKNKVMYKEIKTGT